MSAQHSSQCTISTSPPKLDSTTRNLLDDFLDQTNKEKTLFMQLKSRSSSTSASKTGTNSSSSGSSASSLSGRRRNKNKKIDPAGRHVLDLLPRGRSGKSRRDGQEGVEEDEASLIAQAEALGDLERLNGVEPSMPISSLRLHGSDQGSSSDGDSDYGQDDDDDDKGATDERQLFEMDVDEFRRFFGERWQLSQFWYSSEFAYRLARCLYGLLESERSDSVVPGVEKAPGEATSKKSESATETKKLGFICSPTAYVAFRYLYPETSSQPDNGQHATKIESYLFDYDERFALLAPPQHALPDPRSLEQFVRYDLNEPLEIPSSLEKQLDMVIIDPPYLKAETNMAIAQTVKKLLKSEEGKALLITGESIAEQACEIYGNESTGRLRRAEKLEVGHIGLKNKFGAWGNWDGVERLGGPSKSMRAGAR